MNVAPRAAGFGALVGAKKPAAKLIVPLIVALGVAVALKATGEPDKPVTAASTVSVLAEPPKV